LTSKTDKKRVIVSKSAKYKVKAWPDLHCCKFNHRVRNFPTYIHPITTSKGITKVIICWIILLLSPITS
jgi:hypothetical protein